MPITSIWDAEAIAHYDRTPPAIPRVGQLWYDTSTNPPTMRVYDGTVWVVLNLGGGGGGGVALPAAIRKGDVLVVDDNGGGGFTWTAGNVDAGRY